MAFAMSLPRTKRIKFLNPDGTEVFQEEDKWVLVRSVHSNQKEAKDVGDAVGEDEQSDGPVLPVEALTRLQVARGELNMMLDLIEMLEAQQHMDMANVPPQKSTLQQLTRQRDLRLQTRASHLRDAATSLTTRVGALRAHLGLEDRYFEDVAGLAVEWLLRPAPDFNFSNRVAPYIIDLGLPRSNAPASALHTVNIIKTRSGRAQVATEAGDSVVDFKATGEVLTKMQQEYLWQGLCATLNEEAQASNNSSAAQALAREVLAAIKHSEHPVLQELGLLLRRAYLEGLSNDGPRPKLLSRANAWLRHKWFMEFLRTSLEAQVRRLQPALQDKVEMVDILVAGAFRSVVEIRCGGFAAHLVVRSDSLEVRDCTHRLGDEGSRWAHDSVLANVGKQEIGGLLYRLLEHLLIKPLPVETL